MHPYKSVLCLNGTLPSTSTLRSLYNLPFIATDGAAQRLMEHGIFPQLIVGDGDSLEPGLQEKASVILSCDQETCDFEKAINIMKEEDFFPALVCGISGGELDHQHNNLSIFMKHGADGMLVILDEHEGYPQKRGFAVQKSLTLNLKLGSTVSLLAFPHAKVRTKGLQWPLHDEVLGLLGRSGARNCAIDTEIILNVSEGLLLVIVDA